ncbi:MAG: aminopeptidase [Fibrobacterota bacterium]
MLQLRNIRVKINLYKTAVLLLLIIMLSQVNCFYVKQGYYVLHYSFAAQKNEKLLERNDVSDSTRAFLALVNDIRAYTFDSIGLKRNRNYTGIVQVENDYLINVVSACKKTSFDKYQWKYPFFGKAPYKGYFDKEDAVREGKKLDKKGYDVYIGKSDAFSTLGILSDPLYSYMQSYSEYALASMIIHEQTHATLYLKNNVDFFEQAAVFIGDQGGINFIRHKYGENSDEYKNIFLTKGDYDVFIQSLRDLYHALDSIYKMQVLSDTEKLSNKEELINRYKKNLVDNYSTYFKTDNYRGIDNAKINNAYITSRMTYHKDLSVFDSLYKRTNYDLKKSVSYLMTLKNEDKPFERMKEYLQDRTK